MCVSSRNNYYTWLCYGSGWETTVRVISMSILARSLGWFFNLLMMDTLNSNDSAFKLARLEFRASVYFFLVVENIKMAWEDDALLCT